MIAEQAAPKHTCSDPSVSPRWGSMIPMWFHPACASAIPSLPVGVALTGIQLGGLQTMSLCSFATLPVWNQLVASWETLRPCPCAPSHPAREAPAISRPDSPLDYITLTVAAPPAPPDWHPPGRPLAHALGAQYQDTPAYTHQVSRQAAKTTRCMLSTRWMFLHKAIPSRLGEVTCSTIR